jgi:hypothetical protein
VYPVEEKICKPPIIPQQEAAACSGTSIPMRRKINTIQPKAQKKISISD